VSGNTLVDVAQDYAAMLMLSICTAATGGEVGSGFGPATLLLLGASASINLSVKLSSVLNLCLLLTLLADPLIINNIVSACGENAATSGLLALAGMMGAILGTTLLPLIYGLFYLFFIFFCGHCLLI
jgi:hypothetical protein